MLKKILNFFDVELKGPKDYIELLFQAAFFLVALWAMGIATYYILFFFGYVILYVMFLEPIFDWLVQVYSGETHVLSKTTSEAWSLYNDISRGHWPLLLIPAFFLTAGALIVAQLKGLSSLRKLAKGGLVIFTLLFGWHIWVIEYSDQSIEKREVWLESRWPVGDFQILSGIYYGEMEGNQRLRSDGGRQILRSRLFADGNGIADTGRNSSELPDGSRWIYVGEWRDGFAHGEGRYTEVPVKNRLNFNLWEDFLVWFKGATAKCDGVFVSGYLTEPSSEFGDCTKRKEGGAPIEIRFFHDQIAADGSMEADLGKEETAALAEYLQALNAAIMLSARELGFTTSLCRFDRSEEVCAYLKNTEELMDSLSAVIPPSEESYFFWLIPDTDAQSPRLLIGPFLTESQCISHRNLAENLDLATRPCKDQRAFKVEGTGYVGRGDNANR